MENVSNFYVKAKDGTLTPIDYEVTTFCMKCGKEITIELKDLICDGEIALESHILCHECTKEELS